MMFGRSGVLMALDELDRALLRALENDARQTNRDLADAAGVAPSTSLERVRSLRERGVIRGFHADIDLAAVERPVQALISVRIRPPSRPMIEGFREWVIALPETIGLFVPPGRTTFSFTSRSPTPTGCMGS